MNNERCNKYMVCPTTGELPFLIEGGDLALEQALNYVVTEEYYAVELTTMCLLNIDGSPGEPLEVI